MTTTPGAGHIRLIAYSYLQVLQTFQKFCIIINNRLCFSNLSIPDMTIYGRQCHNSHAGHYNVIKEK